MIFGKTRQTLVVKCGIKYSRDSGWLERARDIQQVQPRFIRLREYQNIYDSSICWHILPFGPDRLFERVDLDLQFPILCDFHMNALISSIYTYCL